MPKITSENAFQALARFASLRPRSEWEIKNWLKKKKINKEQADKLFNQLKSMGFVDDKAFCLWWIEQRLLFRPKSRRMLIEELKQKGISRQLLEEIMTGLENIPKDEELAKLIIEKKKNKLPKEKLISLLERRGFSWNTIKSVLKL